MTREEQIKQAAEAFARSIHSIRPELNADSFRQGAEWADSHPNGNVIRWQTGKPSFGGAYLVCRLNLSGNGSFVSVLCREGYWWIDIRNHRISDDEVIAWCKLSDIKPYKED